MFNYDKSITLNSFKRRKRFFMKFFYVSLIIRGITTLQLVITFN